MISARLQRRWSPLGRDGKPVILFTGAHLIKNGLGPLLVDLVERGAVTLVAGNGATAIHDFELALVGETSENVPAGLDKGQFGMAYEFAYINLALSVGNQQKLGYGESLGRMICDEQVPPGGSLPRGEGGFGAGISPSRGQRAGRVLSAEDSLHGPRGHRDRCDRSAPELRRPGQGRLLRPGFPPLHERGHEAHQGRRRPEHRQCRHRAGGAAQGRLDGGQRRPCAAAAFSPPISTCASTTTGK